LKYECLMVCSPSCHL